MMVLKGRLSYVFNDFYAMKSEKNNMNCNEK